MNEHIHYLFFFFSWLICVFDILINACGMCVSVRGVECWLERWHLTLDKLTNKIMIVEKRGEVVVFARLAHLFASVY